MSKANQAIALYNKLTTNGTVEVARKDIIAAFVSELGLSVQGASTYHGNIKRNLKGWSVESRVSQEAEKAAKVQARTEAKATKEAQKVAKAAERAASKAAKMAEKEAAKAAKTVATETTESIAA